MSRWTRWIPVVLAIAVLTTAADADAQRRGRGRGRRGGRRGGATAAQAEPATESAIEPATEPEAPAASAPGTSATPSLGAGATPSAAGASAGADASGTATSASGTAMSAAAGTAPAAAQVTPPAPTPPDLAPLRQEYVAIMDEMVQARSRVAILGQELFQTRMTVQVQDRTGDEATLARFVLELDGTPIYDSEGEIEGGSEGRQVFEGALAPGPHVLTLEMEQRAREDTEYRVTQRESFRFVVVRERLTEVTLVLEDDSDIARAFPSGGEGHFDVRTRLRVATRALPRS